MLKILATIGLIQVLVSLTFTQNISSPLCDKTITPKIDSAVALDSETIYVFTEDLVNVIKAIDSKKVVVQNVSKIIDFWKDPELKHSIIPPIDVAFSYSEDTKGLSLVLINLKVPNTKYWVINTTNNEFVASGDHQWNENVDNISNIIDVFNSNTTNGYIMAQSYDKNDLMANRFVWSSSSNQLKRLKPNFYLKTKKDSMKSTISLIEKYKSKYTQPFKQLNDSDITACLIHNKEWILIANQYFCRMNITENYFNDLCEVQRLSDWIQCSDQSSGTTTSDNFNNISNNNRSSDSEIGETFSSFSETTTQKQLDLRSNSDESSSSNLVIIILVIVIIIMIFILAFVAFFFLSISKSGKSEAKKEYLPHVKKEKSNKRLDNEKEKNKFNEGMAVTQKESYAFVVSGKNITEPIHIEVPEHNSETSLFAPTALSIKANKK